MPSGNRIVMPVSILDTDLYKFTMQQAVMCHFLDVQATYRFTHRAKDVYFSHECIEAFKESISHFSELSLTESEREWMEKNCPYFKSDYLQYLSTYRFKPDQVRVRFLPVSQDGNWGHVEVEIAGPWIEAILWEVPLMACLSELYFQLVDTDWSYDGQEAAAFRKGEQLLSAGCVFSEFGTRRRRSFFVQDLVVRTLVRASTEVQGSGKVLGTSNVHLARQYNVPPIGTIAHEWFMAVGALKGYEHANALSLSLWEVVYPDALQLALTDTFSTEVFFRDFIQNPDMARRWKGLRQDSGDPFVYAPHAKEIYEALGVDHHEKIIIFSDALDVGKAIALKKQCDEIGFISSFGIGTSLTNDFRKLSCREVSSKALNMVIKLAEVDGASCVKISDEMTKNTGDPVVVQLVKNIYNLQP
ncbi:uncharacterized protein FIBRA_06892 [Fibroporia radiculosa]|uniref:Nicotinate phosphoribosyltransferase n=1 Tax=Fibroporia radiculosa TaxID=599839 RepID=J4IBI2_9APHY|nr:uncharacterized protein FIBRA_06892 [Fibroporia radiculosa]CCM04706.1 predicted protein [Fibroporia radiculosa]